MRCSAPSTTPRPRSPRSSGWSTDVQGQARTEQFTIGDDGSVTDASKPPTFPNRFEAEEWSRIRQSKAQAIADDITAILGKAEAADATLAGSIPSGHVTDVDEYGTADPEWPRSGPP